MPQVAAIATNYVFGALITSGVSYGASVFIAKAVVNIGGYLLLSAAANALTSRDSPKAQDLSRQLSQPSTEPVYRYVYGNNRAVGTPAGTPVRGKYIWGCWILNSRPSSLSSYTLYLDKRPVTFTGDPFDFTASGGATATNDPFDNSIVKFWISKGDKTTPPAQFTTDAPYSASGEDQELWKTTDGWQGRTVIWMRLDAGENDRRQERWPSTPPTVEVEGDFSLVWDPREVSQDKDDPSTWTFSENWALCVLDALRQNPIKPYPDASLDLDLFEYAADESDISQALDSGGSEAKYRCSGTLTFDNREIEDQVTPMVASAAGNLVRTGGRLGLLPAKYETPNITITRLLGNSLNFVDLIPGNELVNQIRVSYLNPDRGYESANLEPWDIPGALAADGGLPSVRNIDLPFCPSSTQAARVRKITGGLLRRQNTIEVTLGPEAVDLLPGSTLTLTLDSPFDVFNGIYEVQSTRPGLDMVGETGVSMRIPVVLTKHDSTIYDWTPATDEEDIVVEPYFSERDGVDPPSNLTGTVSYFNNGTDTVPRVKLLWDPSTTTDPEAYELQYREDDGSWQQLPAVDAEVRDTVSTSQVVSFVNLSENISYDFRVRTVSTVGKSNWITLNNVSTALEVDSGTATAGYGSANFTGNAPDSPNQAYIRIFRTTGTGFNTLNPVTDLIAVAPSAAFDIDAGDTTITNEIADGDFSSAASWLVGGNWTIASGQASCTNTGTASVLQQNYTPTDGATVRLSYNMVSIAAGTLTPRLTDIGVGSTDFTAASASGIKYSSITAPSSTDRLQFIADQTFDGVIDDVFIYQETVDCLPQGPDYYWIVPYTSNENQGTPDGPYLLTIL